MIITFSIIFGYKMYVIMITFSLAEERINALLIVPNGLKQSLRHYNICENYPIVACLHNIPE